jgi:hypothetical protein
MGLEGVELLLDVEETFSITIDDHDVASMIKVGDLYCYLVENVGLGTSDSATCLSSTVFYRLRRALIAALGVERKQVRPDTTVESLLPCPVRPEAWRRLGAALDLKLPPLERPGWVYSVVIPAWVFGIGSTGGLLSTLVISRENELFSRREYIAAAVLGYAVAIGVEVATRPLERRLPRGCESVGGLVEALVTLNFARLRSEQRAWSRDDVWTTVRGLVARQAGIAPEDVTTGTRFDDLWG